MTTISSASPGVTATAQVSAASSRPLLVFAGYLAFLAVSGVSLSALALEPVPTGAFLLAMVLLALCLLPLTIWQAGQRKGAPMFEVVCVAFAAAYAFPVFLIENAIKNYNQYTYLEWGVMTQALGYVVVGVAAMLCGYYLLPRLPLGHWLPRTDLPLPPQRLSKFLWIALGAAGGLRVIERLTSAVWGRGITAAATSVLHFLVAAGVVLMTYRVFRAEESKSGRDRLLLYGVVAGMGALGLGTGMLETAFLPLVVMFIARWHASRRFPIAWMLCGSLAFLLLNGAKHEYRAEVWVSSKEYSLVEQVEAWARTSTAVAESLTTADGVRAVFYRTFYRLDLIHTMAHVMDLTPSHLPFYGGVSYEYLLYGWVPRVLWPNKPAAHAANDLFSVDYGLLLESQIDSTQMGIGFLAEAYANFGLLGVIGVMFLIGCLFGTAHMMFNGPDSDGGRAVYISVLAFYLNGIGSATAMFVFFGIQGFIVLPLILRFFTGRWRAPVSSVRPAPGPQDGVVTASP